MRGLLTGLCCFLAPAAAGAFPALAPAPADSLIQPVVMGGGEPSPSVLRSTVWVYITSLKKGVEPQSCSGVIVTELHIALAAHCFDDIEITDPEKQVKVFYYKTAEKMEVWSPATKVTLHPNYTRLPQETGWTEKAPGAPSANDYDLAVLTLKMGIPKGYAVMHAALGPLAPRADDYVGVAGFGLTKLTPDTVKPKRQAANDFPPLRMAQLEYDSFNATRARFHNVASGVPLKGDSGGPSFVFDKKGDPRLWGIITRIFTYDLDGKKVVEGGEIIRLETHWPWLAEVVKPELQAFASARGVTAPPVAFAGYVPRLPASGAPEVKQASLNEPVREPPAEKSKWPIVSTLVGGALAATGLLWLGRKAFRRDY